MEIIETNLEFSELSKRNKTNKIILHNSGVSVLQPVEVIHNYHKNSLGWAGIGYHLYIRKDGSIYRGRPEDTVGAHAYGSNSDSIGICFEGNFDKETMSEAQIKAGQEAVTYFKNKYGINEVLGHRDVCNTSCPGVNFPFEEIANGVVEIKAERECEDDMVDYQNGSTVKEVFETSEFNKKIGQLNTWEKCKGKKIAEGVYLVLYKIDGKNAYKSGFVRYNGGIR